MWRPHTYLQLTMVGFQLLGIHGHLLHLTQTALVPSQHLIGAKRAANHHLYGLQSAKRKTRRGWGWGEGCYRFTQCRNMLSFLP